MRKNEITYTNIYLRKIVEMLRIELDREGDERITSEKSSTCSVCVDESMNMNQSKKRGRDKTIEEEEEFKLKIKTDQRLGGNEIKSGSKESSNPILIFEIYSSCKITVHTYL